MTDETSQAGPVDVGLQTERTYLAWTRTGLAFAAIALLLMRQAVRGHLWLTAFAAPGAFGAAFILARSHWRYQATVASVERGNWPASPRLVAAVSLASCLVSIGGLVAIVFAA